MLPKRTERSSERDADTESSYDLPGQNVVKIVDDPNQQSITGLKLQPTLCSVCPSNVKPPSAS